ncbi:MAG: serine/threonine protein kinase [Proteobacteria bacterium]|nr:serine/threonine protein kinase [Pseudomonadota bacterium]
MQPETFEPIQFGRYRLEQRLAVGGMAEIFRARSFGAHGFEKTLVIKRILPDLGRDREFVAMFIEEARMMTRLNHPKIVQVHDFGEVNGHYYIAMEYVSGMDLLELLRACARRRVRPTTAIAVHIMAEVLDALDFAHGLCDEAAQRLGLVHSDVSPSNIFISELGEVKLGDFGIARAHGSGRRSETGALRGKYGYMSPEQVSGQPIDGRADVFAAGIVLCELLMIRRLFIAKHDLEVLLQVRDARLDRLYQFGSRIPGDLMTIIESALARQPALRYQSAGVFRDALHRYLFENRRMVRSADVRRFMQRLLDERPLIERPDTWDRLAAVGGPGLPPLANEVDEPPLMSMVSDPRAQDELDREDTTPPIPAMATAEAPAAIQAQLMDAMHGGDERAAPGAAAAPRPSVPPPLEALHAEAARGPTGAVVGRKRRIALAPPPTPMPVPQGLPHTGEEPRLGTEHALAAAPELAIDGSTNLDFRTSSTGERQARGDAEPLPSKPAPAPRAEEVAAGRVTAPIGVRPPAEAVPDLEGKLQPSQSIFRLLFRLACAEDSGLLVLTQGGSTKEIYLADGHPHYVSSNQADELFGQYLVKRGVLSAGELAMALAMLPHFDGRLGDTLVALKLMRPMQVIRHLTFQVREKLLNAFSLTTGSFAYYRDAKCLHESAPLGLDAYEMLGAGAQRIDRQLVQNRLELDLDRYLQLRTPAPVPPEVFRLGEQPRRAGEKLNGEVTLRQLLGRFDDPAEQEAFERVVFLLLETGLLTV